MNKRQETAVIKSLPESVAALPVLNLFEEISIALKLGNVLLHAEPGGGKSTGLPLALLLDAKLNGKLILLEPRRLAARSVAERLAWHLGEQVGQRVGLRMRSDTRVSAQTQLEVVTEGVLTRLLQSDPMLEGVALVIFDEFHERSLHADLGLALCIEVQRSLREDLRLLLMSAALDSEQLETQLCVARTFHCTVRQHPVQLIWVGEASGTLPHRVATTVLRALVEQVGDVLVFLPGVAEIQQTAALLQPRLDNCVQLHRLHSGIAAQAQAKATAPATKAVRRVILATSLAETSITIDGVCVVVDSGLERRSYVDSATGAQRLETVMASQASAHQRAGRAGRTAAGVCYRLWYEAAHIRRAAHWQPEIRRADLSTLLMELGLWGASCGEALPWLEPPPAVGLSRARDLLTRLGLWKNGQLSARGRVAVQLPVHPRLAHMLLWAKARGVVEQAARLAVWIEENPHTGGSADIEMFINARMDHAIQAKTGRIIRALTDSTTSVPPKSTFAVDGVAPPSIGTLLAQAFPDWIARRRGNEPGRFLLACGAGALLDKEEPLAHERWLVVAQLGGSGEQARIFKAMALDIDELQEHSPELFERVELLDWDIRQQRVLAENRVMLGKLIVESRAIQALSKDSRARALLLGIKRLGISCLPWTQECRQWQARVQRMRHLSTPAAVRDYPAVDEQNLSGTLDEWLLPYLQGYGSIKALQQLNLLNILAAMLDYQQTVLLEEWLPVRFQVPSGSMIRLNYIESGNPVLSVRLQEMLGCVDNPTLAKGRVPLKIELLSPARRPVQVTENLVDFWSTSYVAVKKEMAGRYPKHFWPDDPLSARPTTQAKPRK